MQRRPFFHPRNVRFGDSHFVVTTKQGVLNQSPVYLHLIPITDQDIQVRLTFTVLRDKLFPGKVV